MHMCMLANGNKIATCRLLHVDDQLQHRKCTFLHVPDRSVHNAILKKFIVLKMSYDDCSSLAPLLLLMKGHPASGKSTLARLLASRLGIAISDKDDSRDCFQAAEEQCGPAGAWDLNALSYQVMFNVASSQLACGQGVVVDCPLSKVELYQQASSIAEQVSDSVEGFSDKHCEQFA